MLCPSWMTSQYPRIYYVIPDYQETETRFSYYLKISYLKLKFCTDIKAGMESLHECPVRWNESKNNCCNVEVWVEEICERYLSIGIAGLPQTYDW